MTMNNNLEFQQRLVEERARRFTEKTHEVAANIEQRLSKFVIKPGYAVDVVNDVVFMLRETGDLKPPELAHGHFDATLTPIQETGGFLFRFHYHKRVIRQLTNSMLTVLKVEMEYHGPQAPASLPDTSNPLTVGMFGHGDGFYPVDYHKILIWLLWDLEDYCMRVVSDTIDGDYRTVVLSCMPLTFNIKIRRGEQAITSNTPLDLITRSF